MNPQGDLFENCALDLLRRELGQEFQVVLTDNRRVMISVSRRKSPAMARVSRIFTLADAGTILLLGKFIAQGGPLPAEVKAFMRQKSPVGGRKTKVRLRTKGEVFDLGAMAKRVWLAYFGGPMETRITWGNPLASRPKKARRRSIRYGSYDPDLDLVTIHPSLDCADVPREFVEYVIYHELLHKIVPAETGPGGGRRIHTKKFQAMEKRFDGYDRMVEWQKNSVWKAAGKRR